MLSSKFKLAVSLATLVITADAFLLMGRQISMARLDPIIDPTGSNPTAGHVHNFVGSANIGVNPSYAGPNVANTTFTVLQSASCTSVDNTADKSGYWQPAIYSRLSNGTFVPLSMREARIYYLCDQGTNISTPPSGLRMIAGDATSRTAAGNETKGVQYATLGCQMGSEKNATNEYQQRGFIKNLECGDFLRASVTFAECWNGKDLDSSDHISHMAYANGGDCPTTHPVRIPSIVTEWGYNSKGFDPASLVLAQGDDTGFGLHSDYNMGWDRDVLARAIADPTCIHRENDYGDGDQCNTLKATYNSNAAASCKLATEVPQESVGLTTHIENLPGCNPLWNGSSTPLTCPSSQIKTIGTKLVKPVYISYGDIGSELAIAP